MPLTCDKCPAPVVFATENEFRTHNADVHQPQVEIRTRNGKIYSNYSHYGLTHLAGQKVIIKRQEDGKFYCLVCSKDFSKPNSISRHYKSHLKVSENVDHPGNTTNSTPATLVAASSLILSGQPSQNPAHQASQGLFSTQTTVNNLSTVLEPLFPLPSTSAAYQPPQSPSLVGELDETGFEGFSDAFEATQPLLDQLEATRTVTINPGEAELVLPTLNSELPTDLPTQFDDDLEPITQTVASQYSKTCLMSPASFKPP
jgi:hypothetical protein